MSGISPRPYFKHPIATGLKQSLYQRFSEALLNTKQKKPEAIIMRAIIDGNFSTKTHSMPFFSHFLHPAPAQYGHVANTFTP